MKKHLSERLLRPEATFGFKGTFEELFENEKKHRILLDVPSGQTLIRLERESNLDINFLYSSPGTGTRIATVNIEPLKGCSRLSFYLSWSPAEIRLDIGCADKKNELLTGYGKIADYKLIVGTDGSIVRVGGKGIEVMGVEVRSGGKMIVGSSAIDTWHDTIKAIEILQRGTSTEGYVFENVVSCMSITMLCTGFETYCQRRFLELEGEGIKPNYSDIEKAFFSVKERESGLMKEYNENARVKGISLLQEIVNRRIIDFGNYENCKDAFSKAYGLKFLEGLKIPIQTIQKIVEFIKYRHKIIHVSPLQSMLNPDELGQKPQVFANKKTLEETIPFFNDFIERLHKGTLSLRT